MGEESKFKRDIGFHRSYDAPCCEVSIMVLGEAQGFPCCACGTILDQVEKAPGEWVLRVREPLSAGKRP